MGSKTSKEDEAMKEITKFIEDRVNEPSEEYKIFLGGSRAQGTELENSDIDFVLYTKSISPDQLMTKPEIKNYEKIIESFQTQFPSRFQLIMTDHLRYMKFVFTTKQGENVNIDIFLSPDWGFIDNFLGYLKTVPRNSIAKSAERFRYTSAEWLVLFFKQQSPKVKEYIRKAKIWRAKTWDLQSDLGIPKCYLLSLLIIKACELASRNMQQDVVKEWVIHLVENYHTMNIYWEEFYSLQDFPDVPTCPRVLCPSNPYDNVADSAFRNGPEDGRSDWQGFAMKIHHITLN